MVYSKYYNGRLGNKLFQFFLPKIISNELNLDLEINFDLPKEFGIKYKKTTQIPITDFILYEKFIDNYTVELFLNDQKIQRDLNKILETIKNRKIKNLTISGYHQSSNFYVKHRKLIRDSFDFDFDVIENTLGIHIRKGDIEGTEYDLPDEWYTQMVTNFSNHKKIISTDSPNSKIVKKLIDMGCELYQNSESNTILFFSKMSNLILSQGTFSWWCGFLSNGKKYQIIPETGWNNLNCNYKLLPTENDWNYFKLQNNKLVEFDKKNIT